MNVHDHDIIKNSVILRIILWFVTFQRRYLQSSHFVAGWESGTPQANELNIGAD